MNFISRLKAALCRSPWLLLLLVSACGTTLRPPEAILYDLSSAAAPTPTAELRLLDMAGPSWLESSAMQYRFARNEPGQLQARQSFTQSRWSASPTELLGHTLRRNLLGSGSRPGACRLKVDLVEMIQEFDSAQTSHVVLEARVVVQPPKSAEGSIRQNFVITRPAGGDAVSGVAALAEASHDLASSIQVWLAGADGTACR